MGWRLAVAGGNGKSKGDGTEQRERGHEDRDQRGHEGGQRGMQPMTNAVAYQPHPGMTPDNYPQPHGYDRGGYAMYMPGQVPQSREMGFLVLAQVLTGCRGPWRILLIAGLMTAFLYLVFALLFNVPLP